MKLNFRKISLLMMVLLLAGFATGCNILGSDDDDDYVPATSTKLSLVAPVSVPAATSGSSIRAQSTLIEVDGRRLITGATVTVNGVKLKEDPNNPGYYKGEFDRADIEDGFVFEAKKGKMKMVNVVTAKEIQNKNQIQAPVDEVSTAFAEVARVRAGMSDYKDLIERNAELDIDLDELKENVSDESDTSFKTIKDTIKEVFAGVSDADLDDEATGDLLTDSEEASDLENEIKGIGDSVIPVKADEDVVKAGAQKFMDILIKAQTGKALAEADQEFIRNRFSEDFLLNGTTKTMLMSELGISASLRKSETDSNVLIGFEQEQLQIEKISDTAYLAGVKGTLQFAGGVNEALDAMADGLTFDENFNSYSTTDLAYDDILPIMLKKVDGKWLIVGNGVKAENVCVRLQKQYFAGSSEEQTAFWFSVDEADGATINSVSITGTRISGEVALERSPNDSTEWYYMISNGTDKYSDSYTEESWTNTTHQPGDTCKVTVTYSDSAIQEFNFTVPAHSDVSFVKNVEVALNDTQNSLTVNWPQSSLTDFEYYRLNAYGPIPHEGKEIKDKTVTSSEISLIALEPSQTIEVVLEIMTRRGVEQQYRVNYQIPEIQQPDASQQLLQGLVNNMNGGVQAIANTANQIPVVNPTSYAASLRSQTAVDAGYGFPAGTTFHDTFQIEGDDEILQNIFSMPTEGYGVGLQYLLARFFDTDGNLIDYPFTVTPYKMNIGALVDEQLENARAKLDLLYGDEETGGPLVGPNDEINFNVSGDIEVTLATETYLFKIDETLSNCLVSDSSPSGNLVGKFFKDGSAQVFDGKEISLTDATFDANGLVSGTIMVDNQQYATISVENDSVVLELTNSN
jgi:hypothetical protein